MLYLFGDEADRDRARTLSDQGARMLGSTLELARPWGRPSHLRFTSAGVSPERDEVDGEALWTFVNNLTGGFSWTREREGTARLLAQRAPDLLDAVGHFTDRVLEGALAYHVDEDSLPRAVVCYAEGSPRDSRRSAAVAGAFLTAAANAYATGTAFAPPEHWGRGASGGARADATPEARTRALYDAMIRIVERLDEDALLFGWP